MKNYILKMRITTAIVVVVQLNIILWLLIALLK